MKLMYPKKLLMGLMFFLPSICFAEITWNGFLSVGGGIADADEGDELAGYEDVATFQQDSVLGLQASTDINDHVSVTVQILANGANGFDPQVTWANVNYQFSNDLAFKLGRYQTPLYLYSDFLDVGYAYHWISPPSEVYLGAGSTQDGIELIYQKSFGDAYFTGQFFYGGASEIVESSGVDLSVDSRKRGGFAVSMVYDWLTVRAGAQSTETSIEGYSDIALPGVGSVGGLIATLNSLPVGLVGTGAQNTAEILAFQEDEFVYSSLSIKAELGQFLVVTEFTDLAVDDSPAAEQQSWYVSGGYSFGDWMIHLTHSETDNEAPDLTSDIPVIPTVTDGLIALIDGFTAATAIDQKTNSIGVRWDFTSGVAIKAEYSDIDADNTPASSGNLFRVAIDAVF
ncbi:hypothetical protein [Aurantivibrio plasticivorans]